MVIGFSQVSPVVIITKQLTKRRGLPSPDPVCAGMDGQLLRRELTRIVLLHHELEKPWEPAPFRAAVFISSVHPYSKSTTEGVDVTDVVPLDERFDYASSSESSLSSDEDLTDTTIRRLTPESTGAKIRIPTAHIYGENDTLMTESQDMLKMCDHSLTSTFVHHGGHDIPLEVETSKKIHGVIEETIERSHMMS